MLAYVKHCIPGLEAVSSGAIASTYQRTRVEHVRITCKSSSLVGSPELGRGNVFVLTSEAEAAYTVPRPGHIQATFLNVKRASSIFGL